MSDDVAARRLLHKVRRQWAIVLGCAVLTALVAGFVSSRGAERYEATAAVQVSREDLRSLYLSGIVQGFDSAPERQAASAAQLFGLPVVREKAARLLADGADPDDIGQDVTIEPSSDSDLVTIRALADSPAEATALAGAMTTAFIQLRRQAARRNVDSANATVLEKYQGLGRRIQQSSVGRELLDRIRQVRVAGDLGGSGVQLVQPATSTGDAVSPTPAKNAVLGFIGGLVLGALLVLRRARRDTRMATTGELQEVWPLPLLGSVPVARHLRVGADVPADAAHAFAILRANLQTGTGTGPGSVLVTAATVGEGTSTVAWGLAAAASAAGERVVLIDANLAAPHPALQAGDASHGDLARLLAGDETGGVASIPQSSGGTVDLIRAGEAGGNPVALLSSARLAELITELRSSYDLIVLDAPPASERADALLAARVVDATVVVARPERVTAPAFRRLRDHLTATGRPVLGLIVNAVPS